MRTKFRRLFLLFSSHFLPLVKYLQQDPGLGRGVGLISQAAQQYQKGNKLPQLRSQQLRPALLPCVPELQEQPRCEQDCDSSRTCLGCSRAWRARPRPGQPRVPHTRSPSSTSPGGAGPPHSSTTRGVIPPWDASPPAQPESELRGRDKDRDRKGFAPPAKPRRGWDERVLKGSSFLGRGGSDLSSLRAATGPEGTAGVVPGEV